MEKKKSLSYVSRVNQLDSYLLDNEINKIVHEQLQNVYNEFPPGLLSKYQPEIDALLKTFIWANSILQNKSTFGQQVLAITYQSDKITKNRLILHYLLTICAPYTKEVGNLRLTSYTQLQKAIAWIECLLKILSIVNFFRFLKTGHYPSLLDYLLRWNHVSKTGTQMRNVGYDYMNRELVWTGFLELLNVTLPLINYHSIKRKVNKFLTSKGDYEQIASEPTMNIHTKCAICSQRPALPHHIGCSHIFCYYCIRGSVSMDPTFSCSLCDYQTQNGDIYSLEIRDE